MASLIPKKVIVSGVSGQDGSYMVDYLLANTDHLVYGMVRRTAKPDYGNLAKALNHPRFQLVVGDLSDSQSIDNLVKRLRPDYFINLAAQSFVGSSWDIPEMTFDVDAVGVIRCLEAIRKHAPQCRFYNAGSSEEFGSVQYSPQDEKHPPCARSVYGAAKVAARQIVKVYRESYQLYAVQGLLFNHESERRGHEFVTRKITLGVARIARAIKDGKPFDPIELGNLDSKRDWSHAEDFVEGIWRMVNQETYLHRTDGNYQGALEGPAETVARIDASVKLTAGIPHEYVLASGETYTVRTFIEKAFAAASIPVVSWNRGLSNDPKDEVYILGDGTGLATKRMVALVTVNSAFYRPADVELLIGDSTRARQELGWTPKVSFDQLVERMVRNDLAAVGL